MRRFEGRKVLITGAASGIGRASAIRFAAEGASVTIGDINAAGLAETAGMMATAPRVQVYDGADFGSCRDLVEAAASDGLDTICNVSGMLKWGPSEDFALSDFERIMTINATSVFAICQAAMPHLAKTQGCIINTASTAALQGIAYTIAYSASKHAVAAITKGLAIEWAAKGIRVNAICPGHVNTPMGNSAPPPGDVDWALVMRNVPKLPNGMCEPEHIAGMFAYLASEEACKITGSLFTMDGGQLAG